MKTVLKLCLIRRFYLRMRILSQTSYRERDSPLLQEQSCNNDENKGPCPSTDVYHEERRLAGRWSSCCGNAWRGNKCFTADNNFDKTGSNSIWKGQRGRFIVQWYFHKNKIRGRDDECDVHDGSIWNIKMRPVERCENSFTKIFQISFRHEKLLCLKVETNVEIRRA